MKPVCRLDMLRSKSSNGMCAKLRTCSSKQQ